MPSRLETSGRACNCAVAFATKRSSIIPAVAMTIKRSCLLSSGQLCNRTVERDYMAESTTYWVLLVFANQIE